MVGVNIYPKYPKVAIDQAENTHEHSLRIERQLKKYIFDDQFAGNELNTPTSQEYERDPSGVPVDGFIDMVNLSHNVLSIVAREQLVLMNRIKAKHWDAMDSEMRDTFTTELERLTLYAKEEPNGLS